MKKICKNEKTQKVSWKFYLIIQSLKIHMLSFSYKATQFSRFLLFIIFHDDLNCASNSASNCDGEVEFERFTIIHFMNDHNSWVGKLATRFVNSNNARLNQKIWSNFAYFQMVNETREVKVSLKSVIAYNNFESTHFLTRICKFNIPISWEKEQTLKRKILLLFDLNLYYSFVEEIC